MTRQMEVDGAWSLHVSRDAQPAALAVGPGLQEAPDPAGRLRHTWTSRRARDARVFRALDLTPHAYARDAAALRPRLAVGCSALRWRASRSARGGRRHEQGDPPRVSRRARRASIPAAAHDLYSGTVEQAIFETLLTYDYLARPSKLVPLTAEALPQITDNGQTYTFKIRKGIYFTPDPAFKGVKRELVADDYVYSLKRLMDPKIRSPWTWLLEGKIVGLDELADEGEEDAASSTTPRRSPGSRRSTATRCASG